MEEEEEEEEEGGVSDQHTSRLWMPKMVGDVQDGE